MIIDFTTIPFEDIPHFKDGEGNLHVQMYWDGTTRIMHGVLVPGSSIGLHRHEGSCEILFMLRGEATLIEISGNGEKSTHILCAGQCTYCPEGAAHTLINNGQQEVEFYAAVPKQ